MKSYSISNISSGRDLRASPILSVISNIEWIIDSK